MCLILFLKYSCHLHSIIIFFLFALCSFIDVIEDSELNNLDDITNPPF